MSYIIKNKETGVVVCEIQNGALVEKLNTEKYEAVPVKEYLETLNLELNNGLTYRDKREQGLL